MDATRDGQLKRLAKILALRERRANLEAARLTSGIAAGSALRADLLTREHRAEFADLTMRSVARTVGILDRGLRVLQEQKTGAVAKAQCARQAGDVEPGGKTICRCCGHGLDLSPALEQNWYW